MNNIGVTIVCVSLSSSLDLIRFGILSFQKNKILGLWINSATTCSCRIISQRQRQMIMTLRIDKRNEV